MKYKKYSSIGLLALIVMFGSCKKELDQNDPQVFSDANAFRTIDDIQLGVNGAFGRYSTYVTDVYKSALVSDEAKLGADNGGSGALEYRYQYGSDGTTGGNVAAGYTGYYALIDQVNRVLPQIPNVTGGTATRKDELKGHLLGLRALGHFGLLQSFSKNYNPTGLGTAVMTVSDPSALPARNTMGEVMAQIESDLTAAKALLPAVTPANFSDTVLNRVNIAAYQARIALYKGDYTAAITYSDEVIASNVKTLANGAGYAGIWTDANTNESLFRVRLLQSTALGGLWTNTGGSIFIAPSDKLTASYGVGDIRLAAFVGTSGGNRYVNKHYTSARGARIVDLKACRLSEMYLIRAEAYAKRGTPADVTSGTLALNTLRSNRISGYTPVTFATAADLLTAVILERYKELCFEGFRIWDLKRNNLPVQRSSTDASAAWQTLPANSYRFVFPILRDAVLANPNTIQNEGY